MLTMKKDVWTPPETARPYLPDIYDAERAYSLPAGLLARLLYQESRYRQDIITGSLKSSAGAVGIAQIVPRWHPDVDPTDPRASIYYAAKYLRQNFDRFGSWEQALAAYNWGPTALARAIRTHGDDWKNHLPQETFNYVTQIGADVGGLA